MLRTRKVLPDRHPRRAFAVGLVAVALVLGGCTANQDTNDDADASPTEQAADPASKSLQQLASALEEGDVTSVSFAGTTGATVQPKFKNVIAYTGGLKPTVEAQEATTTGENAEGELKWTWKLPNSEQSWEYTAPVALVKSGEAWQPQWAPSIVQPKLAANQVLRIRTTPANRGKILGARGEVLAGPQTVHRIGLDTAAVTAAEQPAAASQLASLVGVDPAAYSSQVAEAADGAWVQAITLRDADYKALDQAALQAIPGAQVQDGTQVLAREKGFATELLGSVSEASAEEIEKSDGKLSKGSLVARGGIQQQYDETLRGQPGVVAEKGTLNEDGTMAGGVEPIEERPGTAGKDVQTTIDANLQVRAQQALEGVESPSSVVMVQPSGNSVLAVANGAGSKGYETATLGQYAPGSVFKIATALAMLRAGDTPDSTVDCPAETNIGGTRIANFSGYPAQFEGTITLREAIAHSCNTAFALQHDRISQEALAEAGEALGLGVAMKPGLPVFAGKVPNEESAGEHVAAMFGQGRTLVSPLAMARLQASVQAGKLVDPVIVTGGEAGTNDDAVVATPRKPLTEQEAAQLRELMRGVVTEGYLDNLQALEPENAIGKTGTAEYGNETPPKTHSWVVADHGDLAASVFVEDGDLGSVTGAPIMLQVLQG